MQLAAGVNIFTFSKELEHEEDKTGEVVKQAQQFKRTEGPVSESK